MTAKRDPGADMTLEDLRAENALLLAQGAQAVQRLDALTNELRAAARGGRPPTKGAPRRGR